MCDTIEGVRPVNISTAYLNSTGVNTTAINPPKWRNDTVPATGVGLERALSSFASWFKNEVVPGCGCCFHFESRTIERFRSIFLDSR